MRGGYSLLSLILSKTRAEKIAVSEQDTLCS